MAAFYTYWFNAPEWLLDALQDEPAGEEENRTLGFI
jgi:hypothetical protein